LPGPGRPEDAGISGFDSTVGTHFTDSGSVLGASKHWSSLRRYIVSAPELMHGKISQVSHTGVGFPGLENPMTATRYHSLVIPAELSGCAGNYGLG